MKDNMNLGMKTYLLFIVTMGIFLFVGCDEREIIKFNHDHEVYFEKFFMNAISPGTEQADSTSISFFFEPEDSKSVEAELTVCLSGRKLNEDLNFGLRVVEEETTATSGEYEIDESYTFRAREIPEDATVIKDSIKIRFFKSERLGDMPNGIQLVVELVGGEDIGVGQYERSRAVVILRKEPVQPEWWNEEVEGSLLGVYTAKKYKTFLLNIKGSEKLDGMLIKSRPDRAIQLVMAFKKWLDRQNPPILEEDGSLMQVAL